MKGKGKGILVLCMVIGVLLSILPGIQGFATASSSPDPSIFRYDQKRTGISNLVSDITEPGIRWAYNTDAFGGSIPSAGDINNDGRIEIVWGGTDGILYALNDNGELLWDFQIQGRIYTPSGICDVDGDDMPEVIFGGYYLNYLPFKDPNLYVVNGEDGSLLWSFESAGHNERGFITAPSFFDVNNDGNLDILIGSMDRYFYALNGADGEVLWRSEKFEHFIRSSSPVGDIDQDGNCEILAVDNHALARLFEMDGSIDWEIRFGGYGSSATPIFADVNGDSYDEIIFFSIGQPGMPSVYRYDGSLLWTNQQYSYFYSTPTLFDVDGDGLLDIINVDSNDQILIAYKGTDGTILYTTELLENKNIGPNLITADIDSDGEIEVLVGAENLTSINVADGSIDWLYDTNGKGAGGPLVIDLDGDGLAEIFIRSEGNVVCLHNGFNPFDLLDKIIEYILGLPDECFKNNADQRKKTLVNKLEEIRKMMIGENYEAAISKLQNDIRPKMDGQGKNDWITCEKAQDDLTEMIDELMDYLESQLD